jgi:hypothetical protein
MYRLHPDSPSLFVNILMLVAAIAESPSRTGLIYCAIRLLAGASSLAKNVSFQYQYLARSNTLTILKDCTSATVKMRVASRPILTSYRCHGDFLTWVIDIDGDKSPRTSECGKLLQELEEL